MPALLYYRLPAARHPGESRGPGNRFTGSRSRLTTCRGMPVVAGM